MGKNMTASAKLAWFIAAAATASAVAVIVASEPIVMRKVARACHQAHSVKAGSETFDCRLKSADETGQQARTAATPRRRAA